MDYALKTKLEIMIKDLDSRVEILESGSQTLTWTSGPVSQDITHSHAETMKLWADDLRKLLEVYE